MYQMKCSSFDKTQPEEGELRMKKKRFSVEQMIGMLKQAR